MELYILVMDGSNIDKLYFSESNFQKEKKKKKEINIYWMLFMVFSIKVFSTGLREVIAIIPILQKKKF